MIRPLIDNKKGGFSDLFIFMIFGIVIVFVSVIMIYISGVTTDKLHETMDDMDIHDTQGNNASQIIDNTMGATKTSFLALQWISVFLMFGMIIGIFIGSYLVTTKPIFFIPYLFIVIIAVVVSVPISNTYETLSNNPTLNPTFLGFTGANWIFLHLPIWITIIGIAGGIIMFTRMGKEKQYAY